MAKQQFDAARRATRDFVCSREIAHHMFHGPVSDRYWTERFRLVAVNMESYGYDGLYEVDRDTLVDWLYDAGGTGTRTTRRTLAILAVLNRRLTRGETATCGALKAAYADALLLEDILDRTVYYNIRPESNANKEQDYAAIATVGCSDVGSMIWDELHALDPHVILVSGHAGLAALNGIARLSPPLSFREGRISPGGLVVQSIAHPSRPHYDEWSAMVNDVASKVEAVEHGCCRQRRDDNSITS